MGTTLSDLATEAKTLDFEQLKSTWREDQQVLMFEDEVFNPSVLTSLNLDPYTLPALTNKCQLHGEDLLSKELEVGLSEDSKRADKSVELVSQLINENLSLSVGNQEVDNKSLRLKTLLRIYHAILREQARKSRFQEEEQKLSTTGSMPGAARLAIKFGIGSLMHMIRRVGKLDTELYKDILQEVTEILQEFKPQSLLNEDPTINSAFEKVSGLFEAIISGNVREIRPKDQLFALNPLLGLSLCIGNVTGVLSLALKFMNLEHTPEMLEVYKTIHPMLNQLYELANNSEMITIVYWDKINKASDMDLDPDCLKVVKKGLSSNSWILTEQAYSTGKHYLELSFENITPEVFIAVVSAEDKLTEVYTKDNTFSYLAGDGRVFRATTEIFKGIQLENTSKVSVFLNLEEKYCDFYINNLKVNSEPIRDLPSTVKLAVLTTQQNLTVKLNSAYCPPDEVRSLLYSKSSEGASLLSSPIFSVLKQAYSDEAIRQLKPLHISSFIIECLNRIGESNLKMLEKYGKGHRVTRKMGLKLSVSNTTLDYLKSLLMKILDLIYSKNYALMSETLLYEVAKSIIRLIRSHLLASMNFKESGISSSLRAELTRMINDFLSTTNNSLMQKELTATLSSCFEAFYESSQEKLDYLINRLIMIKNNQDQAGIGLELQRKMFKKMRNPMVILSILAGEVDKTQVKNFLELLINVTNDKCVQLIQGVVVRTEELVKLLISFQKVLYFLVSQESTQDTYKDLITLYSTKICDACDAQSMELRRQVRTEKITPETLNIVKKTMLYSLFPTLMYIISISPITLEIISQLVPKVLKVLTTLKKYHAPEPELVLGRSLVSTVYESEHPYASCLDTTFKVAIPRAQKYTLTFDNQFMTENGCDYLQLYTDEDKTQQIYRWEGSGFPAQPIVVNNPILVFTFHSDGSVAYWGWKIEILAESEEKYVKQEWPEHVNEACSYAISNMCKKLISHDFDMGSVHESILKTLKNPLIANGIQDKAISRIKKLDSIHPGLIELSRSPELSQKLSTQLIQKIGQESARKLLLKGSPINSLAEYLEKFSASSTAVPSMNPFLINLIEGNEATLGGWRELKKRAGVSGAMTTIGGNDLNQVERAIFAVYVGLLDISDTVSKLFESPEDLGPTLIFIIKHACKIRSWAQQRKQKLMDAGKKEINYQIIAKEVVDRCIILLHSDFRHALQELGIDKLLSNLLPTITKAQTKDLIISKLTGKWKPMQDALDVGNKLRNLISLRDTSKENLADDVKQFMKVAYAVEEVLNDTNKLEDLAKALDVKRTWAISRCLGFNLLAYMISISSGYLTEPAVALSQAMRRNNTKLHYAEDLEGADPYLLLCVQQAFFNLYEVLQRDLRKVHDDKTTIFSLKHAVAILESISLYIKHVDFHKLIESNLAETFKILLDWSKGHIGTEADTKIFAKEDCVTSIILKRENDLISGSLRVKVWEVSEGEHLYLEYFKGGDLRPIVEVTVSSETIQGMEDITGPITMADTIKRVFVRRAYPAAGNVYLNSISSLEEFKFKTHDELYKEKDEELKKNYLELKERVSKASWNLCKILLYSSTRSSSSMNESHMLLIHELYLNALDREFLTVNLQEFLPDTSAIKNSISGTNWIAKNSIPVGLYPNPMATWLKNFRTATAGIEDFVLGEAINAWIKHVDPSMKGILNTEDISILDASGKLLLDEYKGTTLNADHQHDFFRLLQVLKRKAGDFGEESSNFIYQNDLFENLPDDFSAARLKFDTKNLRNVIRNFKDRINPNPTSASTSSFAQFIRLFEENIQTPGLVSVDSIKIPVPDQFLNSEKQLDLYKAIHAIYADSETFHTYWDEIKSIVHDYGELPKSVLELTKHSSEYGDYLGSLLWTIFYTSPYLLKELSRMHRLEYLMKLALLCNSDRINTPAFRILSRVVSSQHSPLTIAKVWDLIKLLLPKTLPAKSTHNIVAYLFTLIGLRNSWQVQTLDFAYLDRQAQEAENCLKTMFFSDRWRKNIIEQSVKVVSELVEGFSNGRLPDEVELGVICFLGMNSPYATCMERLPLVWNKAKVKDSNLDEGFIVGIDGDNVQLINAETDTEATEPISKVVATLPVKKGDIYLVMEDGEVNQLLDQIANLWKVSQTFQPRPTGSIKVVVGMQNILKHFEVYLIEAMNALASKKQGNGRSISKKSIESQFKMLRDYKEASIALASKFKAGPITQASSSMTDEQASSKLSTYTEDDQILAMELASIDIPVITILNAFENGIKTKDQILEIHQKVDRPSSELFKLEYFNDQNFELVDISDTSSFFQTPKGHIVINSSRGVDEKKLITRAFPQELFNKVSWLCGEITVLFTISGGSKTHKSMYGFKIGSLEVNIENIVDVTKISVNDSVIATSDTKPQYSFKLTARATGSYTLQSDLLRLNYENHDFSVFNGFIVGNYGIFLKQGNRAILKGLAIYEGNYPESADYWREDDSYDRPPRGRTLRTTSKVMKLLQNRLALTGAPHQITDHIANQFYDLELGLNALLDNEDSRNWPVLLEKEFHSPIIDVKLLEPNEVASDGFVEIQSFRDGEPVTFKMPGRRSIAIKRHTHKGNPAEFLSAVSIDSQIGTELGNLDATTDSDVPITLYIEKEKGTQVSIKKPLRNLIMVYSTDPYQVQVPAGYNLIDNKEHLAINLAPNTEPIYYAFLCFTTKVNILGCPVNELSQTHIKDTQYGIVDYFEGEGNTIEQSSDKKTDWNSMSLLELLKHIHQIEEKRVQEAGKNFMLTAVKRKPDSFISTAESKGIGYILNTLKDNLPDIESTIDSILSNGYTEFKYKLIKEVVYQLILSSTLTSSGNSSQLVYESKHEYDNNLQIDEVIHIPGAQRLRIEFDPKCETEGSCDYLRFYKSPNRQDLLKEFAGSGITNWQNFEVEGDTVYMYFYTDGSRVFWGYKLNVVGLGLSGRSDPLSQKCNPEAAIWLLERMTKDGLGKGLERLASKEVIVPLFSFLHVVDDVTLKTRALNILKNLLIQSENPYIDCIYEIVLEQTNVLYNNYLVSKSPNPLLQTLILFISELLPYSNIKISNDWFVELMNTLSDMRGVAHKNQNLDIFLFEMFKQVNPITSDLLIETAHPYSKQTKTDKLHFPEASVISVEFDEQCALDPGDDILFTSDREGKKLLNSDKSERLVDANWLDNPIGPDISISNNGKTVTRTSESSWGCVLLGNRFDKDIWNLSLVLESLGPSEYLYIGIVSGTVATETWDLTRCMNEDFPTDIWVVRKNGDSRQRSQVFSGTGRNFVPGDIIDIRCDMVQRTATFLINNEAIYTFTNIASSVTPCICFGGLSQIITIRALENISNQASNQGCRKMKFNVDTLYYHFPINAGYKANYTWDVPKSQDLLLSSDGYKLTRSTANSGVLIHSASPAFQSGKHYISIQITKLPPKSQILFGFIPENLERNQSIIGNNTLVYRNIGNAFFSGQSVACKSFGEGDELGAYIDFTSREVRFYKNLAQTAASSFEIPAQDYKFAVMFTAESQEVRLVNDRVVPEDIDLLNVPRLFQSPQANSWGLKMKVRPIYIGRNVKLMENMISRMSADLVKKWKQEYQPKFSRYFQDGTAEELVRYLDELGSKSEKKPMQLNMEDINPNPKDLVYYRFLEKVKLEDIRELFRVLKTLNQDVQDKLPLFDLHVESYDNLTEIQRVVLATRNYLFLDGKKLLLTALLDKTKTENSSEITVDRPKALRNKERGVVDIEGQISIFGQIYHAINSKPNNAFRHVGRIFRVNYRGEGSIDGGGPYNEVMSNMCDELQSPFLRLLVPTQNHTHDLGDNRDAFTLNPQLTTKTEMDMVFFLGKLFGVAIRTQNNLNFALSPLFWKRLVLDSVALPDLKTADESCFQLINILSSLEEHGITREGFATGFDEMYFTTQDSSGHLVELIENGKDIKVTFDNAKEYAILIEKHRLNEATSIYSILRKGMSATIPMDLLNLFSWRQVETLICGASDIDIDLLKANTEYKEGVSETDRHVQYLWDVLREFSPKQRTLFLKFVWGRSRLPASREFRKMQISRYNNSGPVDNYLPVSHTCFFTIDLPAYSTKEVMHDKLLYAITHCQAIDLDGAAGAGWEDD